MSGQSPNPEAMVAKRALVVRNARHAFIAEGYAAAKMEPIARASGVSTATLYMLFAGKTDLFAAVIHDSAHDFANQMALVRTRDGPAELQLTEFATAYARFMSDPFIRSVFRLVMAERPRFRDVALQFFEKGRSDFGSQLIGALKTLTERGELKVERASWAAGQLMGMIEHPVFFMPLVTGDEVMPARPVDQIAEDAVRTFMARYAG